MRTQPPTWRGYSNPVVEALVETLRQSLIDLDEQLDYMECQGTWGSERNALISQIERVENEYFDVLLSNLIEP
jgi:hypothetical protein